MRKTVAAAELGEGFRSVVDEVAEDHVEYVLTRGQHPEAIILPFDRFQRLLKQSSEEILRRFEEVRTRIQERTAGFTEEEVGADVVAARAELPF